MKNLIAALFILSLMISCLKPSTFQAQNADQVTLSHRKIAILPFKVTFNTEYKNAPLRSGRRRDSDYWADQERLAGLDMQKELFVQLAGQVEKGRIQKVLQNFTETNKILAEAGITIYQLPAANKVQLARVLGVDAIMTGETDIEVYNFPSYSFTPRQGGAHTRCDVYDGISGELVWSDTVTERPSSQLDTPHRLAAGTLRQFGKHNPYWSKK